MTKVFKRLKWFESSARRSYWSTQIDAWLQSGVTRQQYCRDHRLNRETMKRWLRVFETPLPTRRHAEKKPAKVKTVRHPAAGSRAFMAFWSMHLEALQASGLSAARYANVHRLPVRKLRRLRQQLERTPMTQDWREIHHPNRHPPDSSGSNLRDKLRDDLCITASGEATAEPSPARATRRQYTDAQKLAIVAEFGEPGVTASMIARRHQVTASMVFRWRDEFGFKSKERPLLVTARVIERPKRGRPKRNLPLVLQDLLPMPNGAMVVELADGRRVFAPAGSNVEAVRQYVTEQENAR